MEVDKEKFKIIRITADIHPDGDMYIKVGDEFRRIGVIEIVEQEIVGVPHETHQRIRKFLKKN